MKNLEKLTAYELALHHAHLMAEIEQQPPGTQISPAKKREIKAIEKKLQGKLYESLIGDVLPIHPTIEDLLSKSKPIEKKALGPLITFHFEAFSAINTRIEEFKIDAISKEEAWKDAREKTKGSPQQINLKIS